MSTHFYKSTSKEAKIFGVISFLLFVFLIVRAVTIPLYIDEVTSFKYYIKPGVFTPFSDYMRANNHIMNTFFSKISSIIFGENLFGLRLPNLLAFVLYSIYTFKLGTYLKDQFVRWGFYLSMLFLVHFIATFALARGYGLSFGFFLMAAYHLVRLFQKPAVNQLFFTLLALNLALYSNLTLLLSFFIFSGFVLISLRNGYSYYFSKKNRWKTLLLLITHLFFTGFSLHILMVYKEKGLLWWGSNLKTWQHSLETVLQNLFGLEAPIQAIEILLFALCLVMLVSLFFVTVKHKISAYVIFINLFFLSVIGVLVLHSVLGVNYPYQRTGTHFYLFFVLAYFFTLNTFKNSIVSKLLSLPALLIVFHFVVNFNLDKINFWQDLNISDRVFEKVSTYEKGPEIASVKVFGVARFNWMHTKYATHNVYLPMTDFTAGNKNFYYDYVLDSKKRMRGLEPYFDSLLSQHSSTLNLYKRKQPIQKELIIEKNREEKQPISAEFHEFLRMTIDSNAYSTYNVELKVELETHYYPFQSFLVFATENTVTKEKYELKTIDLDAKYYWNKDFPFLINGFIFDTPIGEDITLIVFLWNQKKVDYVIHTSEMKLYTVQEDFDNKHLIDD